MHGKIYRFIFIETRSRKQLITFICLFIVAILQVISIYYLNQTIIERKQRKKLIDLAPEMERFLYPSASRTKVITKTTFEPVTLNGKKYILNGIRELEGRPTALINNEVCQVGDMIGDYLVKKITVDSVLFNNVKTNEYKILRFSD